MTTELILNILTAVGIFGLLAAALEFAFRRGRRAASEKDAPAASQIGAIQGAVLGLLGLLLAFSFSAAGSRFLERQDLIVAEANAIGTAHLRADLLDEPHRTALQTALARYTARRIEASKQLAAGLSNADSAEIERMHTEIWSAALAGVRARPDAALAVLNPVNDVIDFHATRLAAGRKKLPLLVLGLLIASSAIAIATIGYGCGLSGSRRAPLTISLALLIGTSLWITIDLDHPRSGLMRLSDAPLVGLKLGPAVR